MNRETVNKMSFFAKGRWVQKNLSQWVTMVMIFVNGGLAIAILWGGEMRFPPPSYLPLLEYTNGNVWIWGVLIGLAAFLMLCYNKTISIIGLWLSMFWHIVWMTAFIISAVSYERSAMTPIPVYCGLALISATLLTARVIDPKGG